MGSLKGGLGLIWGGLISGGLRVFKGMVFVCFGLDIGWFRVGLRRFRVGFAVGLGLDVDWFCGWPRVGFTGFRVGSSSA